jgi:DNA polymerase III subunit epsilon
MREIVLDTETTGLDPEQGHRVVEIGCIELMNCVPTGRTFQTYVNPARDMPADAFAVHGLSAEFLRDKPRFAEIADPLLEFLGDSPLVIHNAGFDLKFLNWELAACGRRTCLPARAVDTVTLARQKFPGAPASLDALCKRFNVDLSARTKHGALLDAELLACVYLELTGGRQPGLVLAAAGEARRIVVAERPVRPARPHAPSLEELAAHAAFLAAEVKSAIWLQAEAPASQ